MEECRVEGTYGDLCRGVDYCLADEQFLAIEDVWQIMEDDDVLEALTVCEWQLKTVSSLVGCLQQEEIIRQLEDSFIRLAREAGVDGKVLLGGLGQ